LLVAAVLVVLEMVLAFLVQAGAGVVQQLGW
jgi:hypothetical protein